MELNIIDATQSAHQNFLDYLRNDHTKRKYSNDLQTFLDLIPNKIYQDNDIVFTDKTEAFVTLVGKDVAVGKSIISAYVRELNKKITAKEISPSRVLNMIKPIKALFAANDIDFSWKKTNKSIPRPGKSTDKAYSRTQLQLLMAKSTKLIDKVMITLESSAGFRVEAWDYFTWENIVFFYNEDGSSKGGAIRVYRGDAEEYWSHFTPEAQNYLLFYKEEWKSRFFKYPDPTDPLTASLMKSKPVRLGLKGMETRMTALTKNCNIRQPLKLGQKRHTIMLHHGLRKYHNTMLRRAKVDFADKEELQGRGAGGQEGSYGRYEEKDFERFAEYQKAIPFLTIDESQRMKVELEHEKSAKGRTTNRKKD